LIIPKIFFLVLIETKRRVLGNELKNNTVKSEQEYIFTCLLLNMAFQR
jgi:hypothetical protein